LWEVKRWVVAAVLVAAVVVLVTKIKFSLSTPYRHVGEVEF
jgi:hypothetical protein